MISNGLEPRASIPRRPVRCSECRRAKVKCEGGVPCDRCYSRLGCCDLVESFGHLADFMLSGEGGFDDLVEMAKAAFLRQHAKGGMRRDVALAFLGSWRAQSADAGRDVSFGLYDVISEAFGFTPLELEGRVGNEHDDNGSGKTPAGSRGSGVVGELDVKGEGEGEEEEAAWRRRVRESQLFRTLGGCGSMLAVSTVTPQGALVYALNHEWEDALTPAAPAAAMACPTTRAVLPAFLTLSMIAPEDREEYLEGVFGSWGHAATTSSHFIKFCDAKGSINMCIVRMRVAVPWPEHPQHTLNWETIERCPDSRYITTKLGRVHRFLHLYKQRDALGGASGGAEGHDHDDGPFALPPLCCIPLAAPPPEIVSEVADVTDVADFARLKLKRQRVEQQEEDAPASPLPQRKAGFFVEAGEECTAVLLSSHSLASSDSEMTEPIASPLSVATDVDSGDDDLGPSDRWVEGMGGEVDVGVEKGGEAWVMPLDEAQPWVMPLWGLSQSEMELLETLFGEEEGYQAPLPYLA